MSDTVEMLRLCGKDIRHARADMCNQAAEELEQLRTETLEQARLLAMSAEREAKLMAELNTPRQEFKSSAPWTAQCDAGHVFLSGPKCPWCEIERLRAEFDALQDAKRLMELALSNGNAYADDLLTCIAEERKADAIDAARKA